MSTFGDSAHTRAVRRKYVSHRRPYAPSDLVSAARFRFTDLPGSAFIVFCRCATGVLLIISETPRAYGASIGAIGRTFYRGDVASIFYGLQGPVSGDWARGGGRKTGLFFSQQAAAEITRQVAIL